jgi:hypothetical protein
MINIQDYVSPDRTGKAGPRIASMSAGLSSVSLDSTASSAPAFSATDVGKNIVVIGAGAGGANLYTTIATFVDSTHAELAATAAVSLSRAAIAWWDGSQDDTIAFNNAQNDCTVGNGVLYCPGDVYIISSPLNASNNLQSIIGDGARQTFFVCTSSLAGTFLSVPNVPSWFSLGGAPTQGFTILGPGFQTPATVTAWSISSNVATFIANKSFQAGEEILLQGFIGKSNSTVNNKFVTVLASGLSGTQFQTALNAPDTLSVITDTGVANLNWNAIAFTSPGADWIAIGSIEIQAFPGDAVQANDVIVSAFRQLIMSHCGQGFNDMPSPTTSDAGTSLNFDTCYADGNYKAGYYVSALAYTSFNNCAADSNGVAYYLHGAESVSFNGSGSELQVYRNDAYPGYSFYFHGAKSCVLNSGFAASGPDSDVRSTHLVCDDGAGEIFVKSFKANAQPSPISPTNVFTIDITCSDITIWEPDFSVSGPDAWTDSGANDTIYFGGQFHTPIKGTAGTNITGNVASGTAAALPTPNFANSAQVAPAEFSLSSGWGDAASLSVAGSLAMGSLQITANGAGLAANPTVIFTFPKSEAGKQKPILVWCRFDGTIEQSGYWLVSGISNTDVTWVFVGTPAAGQNIGIQWIASSMG